MRSPGGNARWVRGMRVVGLLLASCAKRDPSSDPDAIPAAAVVIDAAPTHAARDSAADVLLPVDAAPTLAADVARRIHDARVDFGANARIRTVGDTFVLVEVGSSTRLFDDAASLVERALPRLLDGRFTKHPDLGVTALFFSDATGYADHFHVRHPDAGVVLGLYQRDVREIAVDVSKGPDYLPTFTHEIVHPLLEEDFPYAPTWLNEGIAALFEAPVFGKDGSIHGQARNWRHAQLQAALASPAGRENVTLDGVFRMSTRGFKGLVGKSEPDAQSAEIEALNYAWVRSVCAWLDARRELWAFYRAWRDGYASDRTGEKAFARVVGGTPKELNATWVGWTR